MNKIEFPNGYAAFTMPEDHESADGLTRTSFDFAERHGRVWIMQDQHVGGDVEEHWISLEDKAFCAELAKRLLIFAGLPDRE